MNNVKRLLVNLKRLKRFFGKLQLQPIHLFFPSLLAVLAALFEGGVFMLLIPTIRGVVESNFEFAYSVKGLGGVLSAFPSLFSNHDSAIFIFLVMLILVFALFKSTFSYFSALSITYQVRRFSHNLRCLIFNSYIGFRKSFFDRNSVGSLQNILIGYTEQIAVQLRSFQLVLYHFFVLFAYLMVMVTISWKVTLFVVLLFPVLILIFKKLVAQIKSGSTKFSVAFSLLGKKITNALSCIPLVKAYGSEKTEREWFEKTSNEVRWHQVGMDKRALLIAPFQEVFFISCLLLLTGVMAYLTIRHSEGNVASYLIFFVVVRRAMTSMGAITSFQGNIASVMGPLRKVVKTIEEKDKYFEVIGGVEMTNFKSEIKFQSLLFQYIDRPILSGVSFEIKKGQMVALVGKTGSGKSTIAQLIMRFYDPPRGSILIDGQDILDIQIASWRKKIAYIAQDNYFFDTTLENNLKYGCAQAPSESEMELALEQAQLADFIQKLPHGIKTEIGERGIQLSGGEKQRLSLARAILRKPEIIILDEATSALDSQTEQLVQTAILEVVKGKTSIVIAHRLSTIQKADFVFVLDSGKLVERGTFYELIKAEGAFKNFWASQRGEKS